MSNSETPFLISFLGFLRRWKRFILINVAVVTILALIISLMLTKTYRAEAKILAGRSELTEMGLSSFVSDLPFEGLGLIPQSDETLRYLAILNSRTVLMHIAEKFNLQQRYGVKNWEKTLRRLTQNLLVDVNPEETISIFVTDESPEVAAEMANAFVMALDSVNITLKIEKARNNRIFLEGRLQECKTQLSQAEENLKRFQEEYGIIEVSEQAVAAIKTISELEAEILMNETELRFKKNYLSPNHLEIERLELRLKELNRTLEKIKYGSDSELGNGSQHFIIPGKDVPQLALRYFRLLREVEVQNLLFKMLTQQHEQATILEAKETPTIQVLDWAVPPIYKYRPKRAYIVLGAMLFSGLFAIFFAAGLEKWRQLKKELQG